MSIIPLLYCAYTKVLTSIWVTQTFYGLGVRHKHFLTKVAPEQILQTAQTLTQISLTRSNKTI
ncbi:hypothetical protein PPEP_a1146 [Pseudoalteromonas peptidolytica F12-50-A1]|uniref:Uncharacterized protein n=1 Tax=Pseudoalteromonas peptidolytica F12-50-A1 TaxID=1315280 RepID=A0A8I0MV93_9GAMM|nr:hypothetical protein [Pseudoalteromonas peptidolytica F12-50-A1]